MFPVTFLPEQYRKQWCIAGGAAACPALAADIDVWVYGIDTDELDGVRAVILSYLEQLIAGFNVNKPIWPEKRYRLESLVECEEFVAYEHAHCRIEKVAIVTSPKRFPVRVKPVHIMVTDAPDPGTILQGFDVSTHAVAIDYDGRIWKGNNWTHPGEKPIALLDNEKTPERMARIAARFGHTLEAAIG